MTSFLNKTMIITKGGEMLSLVITLAVLFVFCYRAARPGVIDIRDIKNSNENAGATPNNNRNGRKILR